MPVTIGQYEYRIDPKNRLVVPPRYREALAAEKGSHFILAIGIDKCIWLFLPSQWEDFERDMREGSRSMKNKVNARALKRRIYSTAMEAPLDEQGRVLINHHLASHAGLRKHVTIAGAGNKAEIWDRSRWESYQKKQAAPSFEKLAKDLDI